MVKEALATLQHYNNWCRVSCLILIQPNFPTKNIQPAAVMWAQTDVDEMLDDDLSV